MPSQDDTPPSATATPAAARAHARAQAGIRVRTQPTVPPGDARDLPTGVAADRVVWDETIGEGGYATALLARGRTLRVTDLDGDACVSLLVYSAAAPVERLSVADTAKVQWNVRLDADRLLLSDMGRALMRVVADTADGHDLLCGPSTAAGLAARHGGGAPHGPTPAARERLLVGLAKHGLGRRDLMPSVNLFTPVDVARDGAVALSRRSHRPGGFVELRAEMDVLIVVANAPHPLDTRDGHHCTPARLTAWRGAPEPGDAALAPEARRALDNTAAHLAGIT